MNTELKQLIEAAVLPEGWVAVPEQAVERINQWAEAYPLDIFPEPDFAKAREALATVGITLDAVSASNMRHVITQVRDLLAAAPKPAQSSPLDIMECLQDRPVELSKAVQGKCVVQAEKQEPNTFQRELRYEVRKLKTGKLVDCVVVEADWPEYETVWKMIQDRVEGKKQEPVKDEPVAWVRRHPDGALTAEFLEDAVIESVRKSSGAWVPLYTHPQPDLTAEVEFMQGKYEEMLEEWLPQKQRIAALEEAAREAREALSSCGVSETDGSDYYNRHQVSEAIAKLDAVLGNV